MAVETKSKRVTQQEIQALVCDRCGRRAAADDPESGYSEFLVFRHTGGYASAWGDGTRVQFEICDACGHELFRGFARLGEPETEWPYASRPCFVELLTQMPNVGRDEDFERV